MFRIYGNRKEREQFLKRNAIPYFTYREDDDGEISGTSYLYCEHDEPFEYHIDLENGAFTVANLLGTCIDEVEFDSYLEGLDEYQKLERAFYGG